MDIEKFISLIYEYKCLWDQNDSSYHLREVQRRAWKEISAEMETPVDDIKKKWRGLRDTFGKELKKSGKGTDTEVESKWPFFKNLLFLKNAMTRRDLTSSVPETFVLCNYDDSGSTNSDQPPSSTLNQHVEAHHEISSKNTFKFRNKLKKHQPDDIETRLLVIEETLNCFQQTPNDADVQFMMSLVPFLKDIPKHRKLIVRAKLQQVLIDEQNTT